MHYTIRPERSSQLGEEKETIEQTRIGVIDINRTIGSIRNVLDKDIRDDFDFVGTVCEP